MRIRLLATLLVASALHTAAQQPSAPIQPGLPPAVLSVLGLQPLLQQLNALQQAGDTSSLAVVTLRQQLLERILRASFDVDSVLGRVDMEASYASEDRYQLESRSQHQAALLNLVTFAASGALGAAGSAMQLTRGLNHAGTALSAAAGGTALGLSAIQLKGVNPKQPVRSPYNMLAELLDRKPNDLSHYPPLVLAYIHASGPDGRAPLAQGLPAAWERLHRFKAGAKGDGASVDAVTSDRSQGMKLSADEFADREAMLHDLHAAIILLRSDLQSALLATEVTPPPAAPQ